MRGVRRSVSVGCAAVLLTAMAAAQTKAPVKAKTWVAVGAVLIASPTMPDTRFQHAVVVITNIGPGGVAGLVLNRASGSSVALSLPQLTSAHGHSEAAYWGGPVHGETVSCILAISGPLREAKRILPGVYVSTSTALMDLALRAQKDATSFRVYRGYTGWTQVQLRHEMALGMWKELPGTEAVLFDATPATLWQRLVNPPATAHPGP